VAEFEAQALGLYQTATDTKQIIDDARLWRQVRNACARDYSFAKAK
jgi:hypothetical protein